MEHLDNDFKFEKISIKSRIKYDKILKKSKDAFPSFLNTKHHYKRRNTAIITDPMKNLKLSKISSELFLTLSPTKVSKTKRNSLPLRDNLHDLDIKKNNLIISPKKEKNHKKSKKNKFLSSSEKNKLRAILKNFIYNKLTTKSLLNIEKKLPLNSVTESNYLFFFTSNYLNKKKYKNKKFIFNNTPEQKLSKSSLLSLNMMKKFNIRTNKLLESEKLEGTKFSNNINEFRKQIINSYKDNIIIKNLETGKINYENALQLLESIKEKRIKKVIEM